MLDKALEARGRPHPCARCGRCTTNGGDAVACRPNTAGSGVLGTRDLVDAAARLGQLAILSALVSKNMPSIRPTRACRSIRSLLCWNSSSNTLTAPSVVSSVPSSLSIFFRSSRTPKIVLPQWAELPAVMAVEGFLNYRLTRVGPGETGWLVESFTRRAAFNLVAHCDETRAHSCAAGTRHGPAAIGCQEALLDVKMDRNPSRINDLGFRRGPSGTPADVPGRYHMWSIITWPKPEHDTCVAPSIRRAKS